MPSDIAAAFLLFAIFAPLPLSVVMAYCMVRIMQLELEIDGHGEDCPICFPQEEPTDATK